MLTSGTRLGPYEITGTLGAGGMGEVYRATDTNLKRAVAIKVLPESVATDRDRLARFQREAEVLASLNHPNIAAIYGLERSNGTTALVMELVEGPTLADRIAQGPIPVDEALPIARQLAEALEAAHEHGIIHRDLKPANIKLRPDGAVKVLDFGLAKALEPMPPGAPSHSPTVTSPAMTRAGLILGTPSYMSPEQARGLKVDRAADIWAWGCVLFEMLTGERAFGGMDATEVIAAVVRGQPDWAHLPAAAPPGVRRLLRRCLEKDRRRRIGEIRDARFAIEDAQQETAVPSPSAARPGVHGLAWGAMLVLVLLAAAAWGIWSLTRDPARDVAPPELRVEITTPPTTDLVSMALSPDGEKIVYVGLSRGRPMLWLRSLVTGESDPLAGTDGATFPFWSPDSRSIGFFANERINRIDVDGGSLRPLAPAPVGTGGTWSRDGVILFALVPDGPIFRVSDTGGKTEILPGSDPSKGGNRFPQFLPDGRRYLYYMAEPEVRGVYVGALDGPERRHLFDADAAAVFVPPAQMLILRAGRLFAQRVDPVSLVPEGEAVSIASGVAVDNAGMAAVSSSSTGGVIAYRVGSTSQQRQLMWVDRSGRQIGEPFPPDSARPTNPSLASDGRQLAINRTVGGNTDVWVLDLQRRGAFNKLTSASTPDVSPVWSPAANRIVYAGPGQMGFDLWEVSMTGPLEPARLFGGPLPEVPLDWSKDGRYVLYRTHLDPSTGVDLWALPMDNPRTPISVARTQADEVFGSFSPDGKWVVMESDETGRDEIYIQRFPDASAKTPLSTGGGTGPRWRPDGNELFYVAPDGRLMSVELRFDGKDGTLAPGVPVALFMTGVGSTTGGDTEYVVSGDGKQFLMNVLVEPPDTPITLVLNRANRPN
jgi:serine/threonine protein kinase/Tol biopolymer transport system component